MNNPKQPPFSSDFVAEIFPNHLKEDEKCVLALHIQYLLLGLTRELSEIFPTEISSINQKVLPYIVNRELYVSEDDQSWLLNQGALDLIRQVKNGLKGVLIKYHACAFTSSTLQNRLYNIDSYNRYKLLVLLCVTRLARMGSPSSTIHKILSEIRQLSLGKRDELLPHLPDPCINELKTLINMLDENRHREDVTERITTFLSSYFVSFNDAYSHNVRSEHNRKSGQRSVTTIIVSPKAREDEDDEGYVVHRLKTEVKENNKVREHWDTEEENNIPEKIQAFAVIKSTSSDPIEHTRRSMKAKNIVDRLSMRNQSLACDYKILTSYEIRILLTCVLDDLASKSYEFNTAKALIFCVLFGRSVTEIEEIQEQRKTRFAYDNNKECWVIKIKHTVSTFKQEKAVEHLITAVSDHVEYYLPEQLSSLLTKRFSVASKEEAQKYLTAVNKKFNTRLSIPRIACYFMDYCKDKNIDPVLVEVIGQTTSRQDSAIPYTHITQQQINTTLNLFVGHLNKLLSAKHLDLLVPNTTLNLNKGISIGSPLMLKNSEIIKVNQQHIHHLKELNSSIYTDVNELHNEFVFYLYRMITMASGYRPVSGTGGKLSDINFLSNEYWISDKENRDRESARIIVLPDMVMQQLEEYKKHLAKLKFKFKYSAINITKKIDAVLDEPEPDRSKQDESESDDQSHFLFLISSDNEILEVSPKTIKPYMDKQFPVQLNWNRHYMRSTLMERNISPSVIYHFMGHDDIGSEGMGRYSGLSYYDFKELSVVINNILEELKFEVVKGL
ncbi:hypothetical protein [Colwellia sp. E2M01]|uniref:hypothetical protein n=1 Tax=Colwellia sp. E2M01 TaxID=2841561 RepID=UPI001C09DCE4|nr:hypothetical protein [Colwellia sp. E2M01]MBU2871043.1 hypothetical protein [Colwellia sp. E2M01]